MIERWDRKSSKEIHGYSVAMLPIGAIEQHGSHLPTGTDCLLINAVVDELCKSTDIKQNVLVLPTIPYGKSTEHMNFPGTISISARTLIGLLEDICASLQKNNIEKLFIINGHGGNTGLIGGMSYDLHAQFGLEIFELSLGRVFDMADPKGGLPESMHAGYAETSVMKFVYPEFSDLYKNIEQEATVTEGFQLLNKLKGCSWGWKTEEISEKGYIGNPYASNLAAGEKLLTFTVQYVQEILKVILRRK